MLATKPYFHFYAKSKIRGFLCSSTQIDELYFHFYTESKIRGFLFSSQGVIKVADTGIQIVVVSFKMLYSVLVYNQFCWIPVSGHWDDIIQ
ncbi:hypothetical protein [Wolbachia endosymbiont of Ctenocephalides felis wCfeJ]|uniref:hypothetical protein n=1 Tax=Wolbachia endosymbiont of Ctenocephalides felis wCfeJ TaxID=2732594 RepID=UPI0039795FC0